MFGDFGELCQHRNMWNTVIIKQDESIVYSVELQPNNKMLVSTPQLQPCIAGQHIPQTLDQYHQL